MLLAIPPVTPAAVEPAADHAFAASLYRAAQRPAGNLFLSPASVRVALAMAAAGALGETEAEMQSVLHLDKDARKNNDAFSALLADLSARNPPVPADLPDWRREEARRNAIELHLANRLWGQSGYPFLAPFLTTLEKSYRAPLEQLDFAHARAASVARINAWVAEQTANKITELVSSGDLTPDTRLVLTDAIYFKAAWTEPFTESDTANADFFTGAKSVAVPTMQQTKRFAYGESDGAKLLELPYGDGSLAMVIALPAAKHGLRALEDSLSGPLFDRWLAALSPQRVSVSLPKFRIESAFQLGEALQAMGMKSAFRVGAANFSGMDGARDLFLGAVLHKAFIDVNEAGTEAAAATAVLMRAGAVMQQESPPKVFKADHPFFFFIRDLKSGAILFAGRVVDPS